MKLSKMRWKLKIAGIFLLILTLLPQVCLAASYKARPNSSPANYSSSNPARLNADMLYATSAVAVDASNGRVLFSKEPDRKIYPASTTKVMTALLTLENLDMDQEVTVTKSCMVGETSIYLEDGETLTVRELLYGLLLKSGNDAAVALAQAVSGTAADFAVLMNERAAELGCVNTHFVNPHGLHNKKHYTCAHDMALIAQAAFQIPLFRKITKTVEYKIPKTKYMKEDRWLVNHQKMLYEDGEFTYKDCEGGKTGFTDEAWNTLVTYAKKDGKTLVCVELRVNGSWKTFNESAELLDYGFDKFRHEEIDAALDTTTLGQLAGICHFGTASVLDQKEAGIWAVEGKSTVSVTIPKKLKTDKLKRGFCDGNKIVYSYQGWEVGEETLKFNNPAFEVTKTEISDATLQGQTDTNGSETETAGSTEAPEKDASGSKGFEEKVDEFMDNITFGFLNIWTSFNGWVDQHEMLSATVGMILILLMIPLIVIAYMRDKNDKLARKEREQDKEQRRKIEENIDSKSFQEIESEIRSELEKEERRKREAEEEEKRLREMEELIDRQKAKEAQETKETKEIKPTEKPEEEILPAEQPKTEDLKKEEED